MTLCVFVLHHANQPAHEVPSSALRVFFQIMTQKYMAVLVHLVGENKLVCWVWLPEEGCWYHFPCSLYHSGGKKDVMIVKSRYLSGWRKQRVEELLVLILWYS